MHLQDLEYRDPSQAHLTEEPAEGWMPGAQNPHFAPAGFALVGHSAGVAGVRVRWWTLALLMLL
jgi:hypothetical protein